MLSANLVAKPTFAAARTGQVMANQGPPSPTPTAVTWSYGLAVLSIKESHSGRSWDMGNAPSGAILYPRPPTNGEAGE
jgi:hypothetical protein